MAWSAPGWLSAAVEVRPLPSNRVWQECSCHRPVPDCHRIVSGGRVPGGWEAGFQGGDDAVGLGVDFGGAGLAEDPLPLRKGA